MSLSGYMVKSISFVAVGLFALSACGCLHRRSVTEKAYAGDTPLKVTNRHATALCELFMVQAGASDRGVSWINERSRIAPGASKEFKVRPGKYQVQFMGCHAGQMSMGGDGTIVAIEDTAPAYKGMLQEFDVQRPTELILYAGGQKPTPSTPGYELVTANSGREKTGNQVWEENSGDCVLSCKEPAGSAAYEACMSSCEQRRRGSRR